jgi:8-oxo-dGTP diphosphatase
MITCTFEDKGSAALRHVTVDNIVLNKKKDQILLVKRAKHLLEGGKYGLVGGFVDRDETLEQAAMREIKEETGYESIVHTFFRVKDNPTRMNDAERQNIAFVFICEATESVQTKDDESEYVGWFDLEKLPLPEHWAFDHYDDVAHYLKYVKHPFTLPLMTSKHL